REVLALEAPRPRVALVAGERRRAALRVDQAHLPHRGAAVDVRHQLHHLRRLDALRHQVERLRTISGVRVRLRLDRAHPGLGPRHDRTHRDELRLHRDAELLRVGIVGNNRERRDDGKFGRARRRGASGEDQDKQRPYHLSGFCQASLRSSSFSSMTTWSRTVTVSFLSATTLPSGAAKTGALAISASNAFWLAGVTSTRKRDALSEKSAIAGARSWGALLATSILSPSPPENAISAAATARPPSERSWQERTRPALIAAAIALKTLRPAAVSTFGTAPPLKPLTSA